MSEKKNILPFEFGAASWGVCPTCDHTLFKYGKDVEINFCHTCGQPLIWGIKPKARGNAMECGACGTIVGIRGDDVHDKYCRECGRPVDWDNN